MPKSITALCAVVIAAGFIVLSGAVLVLRHDVVRLQGQLDARPVQAHHLRRAAGHPTTIHGRTTRCTDRRS